MATVFETTTCGRCGGTGHYSYNQMSGTICFGCNGSKVVLSKRGKTAQAIFRTSIQKPMADVAQGDLVLHNGRFRKVLSKTVGTESMGYKTLADGTRFDYPPAITLDFGGKIGGFSALPDTAVASVKDEAERKAKLAAAVAYQETL